MEQNKQSGDVVVEPQTLRRLESISIADESCDDTLTRLLDDAVEQVRINEVLSDILAEFENAVSVEVDWRPEGENPGQLTIAIHTGDVGLEEEVSLYEGSEVRAVIESKTGERFCLPFYVYATCDGPKREHIGTTPVYRNDDVLGLEEVKLAEGLDQLRAKIGKPHDEVRELVHDF